MPAVPSPSVGWPANGLPLGCHSAKPRTARLRATLERVLPWWRNKSIATINAYTVEDYASQRAPALRSADLELAAVSSL